MTRIPAIDPTTATGKTKELLDGVQKAFGATPNMFRTIAHSPAALSSTVSLFDYLGKGVLSAKLREQIALNMAQFNGCDYCASAHGALGKLAGLGTGEVADAMAGRSSDAKTAAVLGFVSAIVKSRGHVGDADLAAVRKAGTSDAEIIEIVAHVALNTLTNYVNSVAETVIDFPRVMTGEAAA